MCVELLEGFVCDFAEWVKAWRDAVVAIRAQCENRYFSEVRNLNQEEKQMYGRSCICIIDSDNLYVKRLSSLS